MLHGRVLWWHFTTNCLSSSSRGKGRSHRKLFMRESFQLDQHAFWELAKTFSRSRKNLDWKWKFIVFRTSWVYFEYFFKIFQMIQYKHHISTGSTHFCELAKTFSSRIHQLGWEWKFMVFSCPQTAQKVILSLTHSLIIQSHTFWFWH